MKTAEMVTHNGGPALKLGDRYQGPGVVCRHCRDDMAPGWCASPKHPTFREDGHLVQPFQTGPREKGRRHRPASVRKCAYAACGREFQAERATARYHSEACKQRAKRERARA